jgi:hypothetical protein
MAILFISAIVLSWGPYYKPDHSIRFPFYYLSKFVFGLRDVRAPGRFGMFIALPLSVFSVAFLRIAVTSIKVRHWISFLVIILIVLESFPTFPVYPFSVDSEGVYKRVCQVIKPGTPLLELPVLGKNNFETIKIAMEQLDGSTIHWARLVVGYGAKTTSQYTALLKIDRGIQEGLAAPSSAIKFAKRYGISYFLIHLNRYNPTVAQKWKSTVQELGGQVFFQTDNTIFMSLKNGQTQNSIKVIPDSCTP